MKSIKTIEPMWDDFRDDCIINHYEGDELLGVWCSELGIFLGDMLHDSELGKYELIVYECIREQLIAEYYGFAK